MPAVLRDFHIYLSLKSERPNIYWSGFAQAPEKEKLRQHFVNALSNQSRDVYLFKFGNDGVGYLYLDYFTKLEPVEVAYGISEKWAGRGLAKTMITQAIEQIRPSYNVLTAWIAESNIASIKTAISLGFEASETTTSRKLAQCPEPIMFIKFVCKISQNNKKSQI